MMDKNPEGGSNNETDKSNRNDEPDVYGRHVYVLLHVLFCYPKIREKIYTRVWIYDSLISGLRKTKLAQTNPAGLMACFFITLTQVLTCFVTIQDQSNFHKTLDSFLFQGGFSLWANSLYLPQKHRRTSEIFRWISSGFCKADERRIFPLSESDTGNHHICRGSEKSKEWTGWWIDRRTGLPCKRTDWPASRWNSHFLQSFRTGHRAWLRAWGFRQSADARTARRGSAAGTRSCTEYHQAGSVKSGSKDHHWRQVRRHLSEHQKHPEPGRYRRRIPHTNHSEWAGRLKQQNIDFSVFIHCRIDSRVITVSLYQRGSRCCTNIKSKRSRKCCKK